MRRLNINYHLEEVLGAGVSIHPVAFIVVQNGNVRLMPINHDSCIDRLLDYVPDLMEKLNDMFNKNIQQKESKINKIVNEIKKRNLYNNVDNLKNATNNNVTTNKTKSPEVLEQEEKVLENKRQSVNEEEQKFENADGEI